MLSFLLWLISLALVILDVFVARGLLMRIAGLTRWNMWVLGAIDRFGFFIIGIVGFCFALFFEYYYRRGAKKGLLWKRFGIVTIAQLALLVVAYLASLLSP